MSSYRDRFWAFTCFFSWQAYVLLALSVALLFFTLFAWLNQPSAETKPIITLSFVILSFNVVVLSAIIRHCQSRDL